MTKNTSICSGKGASRSKMNSGGYAHNVDTMAAPFKGGREHSGQGKVRASAGKGVKRGKYM